MELLRIAWRVCMWVCPWVAHWLGFASSAVVTQQPAVEDREHPESPFQVADLTYEIASHLNTGDHHRMLTLNKEIYKSVAPTLWSVIDTTKSINPGALITRLNNALALNPSSASRIRNWTIDKYSNPGSDKPALATAMADVVMRLATHGHLDELRKFRWLWKFGPPEGVWAALHKNCPRLKSIGFRDEPVLGPKISSNSSFLQFRDLVGTYLTARDMQKLPEPFRRDRSTTTHILSKMLIQHSPHLRDLTIDGTCRQINFWDISETTWPELQSLSLGIVSSHLWGMFTPDEEERRLVEFIECHERLRTLAYLQVTNGPVYPIRSHRGPTTFRGQHAQLALAVDLPSLKTLDFTDIFEDSPATIFSFLERFSTITALSFIVGVRRTQVLDVLKTILKACPALSSLDFQSKEGFDDYPNIAETTQKATHLRSLTLVGLNHPVYATGLTIIQNNPQLELLFLYGDNPKIRFSRTPDMESYEIDFMEFTVSRDRYGTLWNSQYQGIDMAE